MEKMNNTLRIVLLLCIVVYFIIVIQLLKKKKLALKYSLLWLFMGAALLVLVIFPQILSWICIRLGFADPMNGLFTLAIAFILVLVMALTSIVSKQTDRIKNLVQDNALLEKRLRELEKRGRES
jgi:hypothetical protein